MIARARLPLAVLMGVVVRVPFWAEALRTPVDGDTAIAGLMARHPLAGTTMWGQPYGSPVEAWLLAPAAAAFGWTDDALRLGYFLLGLGLIPLAWAIGGTLHPRAAWPAAALAAVPPPYLLLLSSMPPPLYPATLLLNGIVLLLTLRAGSRLNDPAARPAVPLALAGAAAGLALWTHLMSAATIVGCAGWLLVRARGARRFLLAGLLPLLLFSAPWWVRALHDREARRIVRVSDRQETFAQHLRTVMPRIHEPVGGLFGTHVPLVADEPESMVRMPPWLSAAVVLAYGITLVFAVRAARHGAAAVLLLVCAGLALLAFPIPVRAGPSAIRFVTLLWLPVTALVAWVAARRSTGRRTLLLTLTFLALHVIGGSRLLEAWRVADRTQPPFLLVDLRPLRELLEAQGIRHVYASYGPAWRLTWSTRERIVASQPWNERFLHYPLPYLDEVRFSKDAAWVLTPSVPTDLPPPRRFEDLLGAAGGSWRRAQAGGAVVYHRFQPPFDAAVVPLEGAGAAGDGDPATALTPPAAGALTLAVRPPRALDAVTLVSGASGPRLPRSLDVEVSEDGVMFTLAAKRRRRGERDDLRWVNGHPQFVLDNDVLSVPVAGRLVAAVRLRPVDSQEPWSLGEVLLHPAGDPAARAPWPEWLDPGLGWADRRAALRQRPLRDRADWYARYLLAARAR